MQAPNNLPPPIRTDGSNPFAYNTMRLRQVRMIDEVIRTNPDYPKSIRDELLLLKADLQQNRPIVLLNLFPVFTPDYMGWAQALIDRGGLGRTDDRASWLDTDWFFAETVLFRLIIEAVRWWETERDPYAPMKLASLDEPTLWQTMAGALALPGGAYDRLPELFRLATWGNRIDLGYKEVTRRGTSATQADLLVDDSVAARDWMLEAQLRDFPAPTQGMTHIVADNAGPELMMDLVLADALLLGFCDTLVLHVKYHPTFVSDATVGDVRYHIRRLIDGPHDTDTPRPELVALGQRLQAAFDDGRLRLSPNLFWNSSSFLWDMPQALERIMDAAQLVILKGDANYRRAVGDSAGWFPETPFAEVLNYLNVPVLALRTLKSDPIIGLPEGLAESLDSNDPEWRVNGKRGVIQFKR